MLSLSSPPSLLTTHNFTVRSSPQTSPRAHFRPPQAFSAAYSTLTEESISSYLSRQDMASCTSLYEILRIPTFASCHEIKTAYRRLARICHPDVAAVNRKDSSGDDFMKIRDAYSTLSDPEKRADYDRSLLCRYRPLTSMTTSSGFSGYTSRNWETDQCW